MTEIHSETNFFFDTNLNLWLLIRPAGSEVGEWQDYEQGPGRFAIPAGFEVCLRIRNIDDGMMLQLANEIAKCQAVVCLNLSENRKLTNDGLHRIAGLTQLKILNLSSCDINDRGLAWLTGLKNLIVLNLSYCNRLSDVGLKHLRSLHGLIYLDLQGCPRIHHAAIIKTVARRGLTIHT